MAYSSKRLREMVKKKEEKESDKVHSEFKKDMDAARDRGMSTPYLEKKAEKEMKKGYDKSFGQRFKDEDLIIEYGKDAPRDRSFMSDYDRPQKKAGGGRVRGVGAALGGYGKGPYSDKLI